MISMNEISRVMNSHLDSQPALFHLPSATMPNPPLADLPSRNGSILPHVVHEATASAKSPVVRSALLTRHLSPAPVGPSTSSLALVQLYSGSRKACPRLHPSSAQSQASFDVSEAAGVHACVLGQDKHAVWSGVLGWCITNVASEVHTCISLSILFHFNFRTRICIRFIRLIRGEREFSLMLTSQEVVHLKVSEVERKF
jgi:hypothetical protein